jgi:Delta24-sterol reductase
MNAHNALVAEIASQIRSFYTRKLPFRISHGSTNSTRHNILNRTRTVDISKLQNVLSIDTTKQTCLVEPNVPMDALVAATLKYGLVPPVVMEFPGITCGGGYSGTAGESSSFKHGFFDTTINWVEIVLGDGTVVKASESERADLFKGAAGAVGSLGVTTMMELKLTKAKKFVEATYHPVSGVQDALDKIKTLTAEEDIDYVDGIMFSKSNGAVVSGKMVDKSPTSLDKVQSFSRPWDPWFYLHVQDSIRSQTAVTELIPLAEYLFRYDRGGFWVGASAFKYWHGLIPFNRYTRWFLDDFLHTRMLYRALHASRHSMRYVVQDLAMPFESAPAFVNYTEEKFGIWPLWLCPLRQSDKPTFHPQLKGNNDMMINIGLWGDGPSNRNQFVELNRNLEQKLKELGGVKWFYAQTYYNEPEFWNIYPQQQQEWYDGLRQKYNATHLPSVYDKVRVDVDKEQKVLRRNLKYWILRIWPIPALWGLWKGILSKDWMIPRRIRIAALHNPDKDIDQKLK